MKRDNQPTKRPRPTLEGLIVRKGDAHAPAGLNLAPDDAPAAPVVENVPAAAAPQAPEAHAPAAPAAVTPEAAAPAPAPAAQAQAAPPAPVPVESSVVLDLALVPIKRRGPRMEEKRVALTVKLPESWYEALRSYVRDARSTNQDVVMASLMHSLRSIGYAPPEVSEDV